MLVFNAVRPENTTDFLHCSLLTEISPDFGNYNYLMLLSTVEDEILSLHNVTLMNIIVQQFA